jgi:hypothetical protein
VFDVRWEAVHSWGGCPTWQLSRYCLGLAPRFDVGQRHFALDLHVGTVLPGCNGTVPARDGHPVSVTWIRKGAVRSGGHGGSRHGGEDGGEYVGEVRRGEVGEMREVGEMGEMGAGVVVGGDVTYTLTVTAPIYVLNWPTATACKSSTWTLLDTGTHTATLPGSQCV